MNGVLNVLKPPAMSSSDVVVFLRKNLNIKKQVILALWIRKRLEYCRYVWGRQHELLIILCTGTRYTDAG